MRLAERLKGFDAYLGTEMNLRLTRMRRVDAGFQGSGFRI
jgi:hypothetical protein